MLRFSVSIGLASLLLAAGAQAATPLDYGPVYDQCKIVSEDPEIADRESGICVTATRVFVAGIPRPGNAASDQALTELVIELAELPWLTEEQCDAYEEEIPEAIRIASEALLDREQAGRFVEVADTMIEQCGFAGTAAISPVFASPN